MKAIKMKINHIAIILLGILLAGSFTACSTTKHLPAEEVLYTGVNRFDVIHKDTTDAGAATLEEVIGAVSYPPNNALFGSSTVRIPIPFGLWVYNRFERYEKGLGKWIFKKLAAKPVYLSTVNPETRVKVATNLLKDYGFFNGNVTYQVDSTRNPRAVKLSYQINMGKPYIIDSVMYEGFSERGDSLIKAKYKQRVILRGDYFSVNELEEERQRLYTLFRNNGYYYYRPEYITFLADTIMNPGHVNLKIIPRPDMPAEARKIYKIGTTTVFMADNYGNRPTDTLKLKNFNIAYTGDKPGLKPNVLRKRFMFRKGQLYSQSRQNYSQEALARLGIFQFTEFRYIPRDSVHNSDTLDVYVNTMFDKPYDAELEFNVTTKSTKQTGPGAIFNLSKKNFMRMGASLNWQIKGSYEWQTNSTVDGESSVMNSYELGTSLSLDFPRIVLPWVKNRVNPFLHPSQTSFKIYVDQLNRARYFKMLSFGGNISYSFQSSRSMKHTVTPLRLEFNTLQNRTARFDSIANANPMLFYSLNDQFIPAFTYTFTYDNTYKKRKRNSIWWENSITSAGNVTSMIYAVFGQGFKEKNKKLLGTPFAQFLKYTTEIRHLYKITQRQHLASRFMAGVIYAYGNKTIAPYSEQFYVGGANSIRAFTVRSIGPGRYHPAENNQYAYVDQTGDIKLEANIEYRFPIIADLYGATFLDAGNVWLMRKDEARPNAEFTLDHFFDSIALGTGLGLRYDLSFLVIRFDMGVALHVPYETGKKGYYNIPKFKDGLGFHFAIGYPF